MVKWTCAIFSKNVISSFFILIIILFKSLSPRTFFEHSYNCLWIFQLLEGSGKSSCLHRERGASLCDEDCGWVIRTLEFEALFYCHSFWFSAVTGTYLASILLNKSIIERVTLEGYLRFAKCFSAFSRKMQRQKKLFLNILIIIFFFYLWKVKVIRKLIFSGFFMLNC